MSDGTEFGGSFTVKLQRLRRTRRSLSWAGSWMETLTSGWMGIVTPWKVTGLCTTSGRQGLGPFMEFTELQWIWNNLVNLLLTWLFECFKRMICLPFLWFVFFGRQSWHSLINSTPTETLEWIKCFLSWRVQLIQELSSFVLWLGQNLNTMFDYNTIIPSSFYCG